MCDSFIPRCCSDRRHDIIWIKAQQTARLMLQNGILEHAMQAHHCCSTTTRPGGGKDTLLVNMKVHQPCTSPSCCPLRRRCSGFGRHRLPPAGSCSGCCFCSAPPRYCTSKMRKAPRRAVTPGIFAWWITREVVKVRKKDGTWSSETDGWMVVYVERHLADADADTGAGDRLSMLLALTCVAFTSVRFLFSPFEKSHFRCFTLLTNYSMWLK